MMKKIILTILPPVIGLALAVISYDIVQVFFTPTLNDSNSSTPGFIFGLEIIGYFILAGLFYSIQFFVVVPRIGKSFWKLVLVGEIVILLLFTLLIVLTYTEDAFASSVDYIEAILIFTVFSLFWLGDLFTCRLINQEIKTTF